MLDEKEEIKKSEAGNDEDQQNEIHFEPIVSLPEVTVSTNEENEEELVKLRAKLFRFVSHEWKERGTGEIKLLRHCENNSVRVVMRRDKTLKICANHFITPEIQLNSHCNSEKDFNWTCFADFADEKPQSELFAIRFGNIENARVWKSKFEEAKNIVKTKCALYNGEETAVNVSSKDESDSDNDSTDGKNSLGGDDELNPTKSFEDDNSAEKIIKSVEELTIKKD
ncbi:ran-specific GTPase-activating protein-like [Ctenocephalides felis]|uniref:ran-specific GTPase-activating protein-like n=1 Tax=Ctenocephalides felis TaxID=7515 RepID=UPI000E6E3664|nr:ran-specific GTPase-activating protein-like [Ctenocephalides felis]